MFSDLHADADRAVTARDKVVLAGDHYGADIARPSATAITDELLYRRSTSILTFAGSSITGDIRDSLKLGTIDRSRASRTSTARIQARHEVQALREGVEHVLGLAWGFR